MSTTRESNTHRRSSTRPETAPSLSLEWLLSKGDEARREAEDLFTWTQGRPQRHTTAKTTAEVFEEEGSPAAKGLEEPTEEQLITQTDQDTTIETLGAILVSEDTSTSLTSRPKPPITQAEDTEDVTSDSPSQPSSVEPCGSQSSSVVRHSRFTIKSTDDVKIPVYSMLSPDQIAVAPKDRSDNHIFSYLLFRGPEKQEVNLHYIWQIRGAEACAKRFLKCKVVGFDTEFSYGCSGRVQLIQIASETDIALFHVALLEKENPAKALPNSLRKIFESPNITKTGSKVELDADKVKKAFRCKVQACVDSKKFLHAVHENEIGEKAGLSAMTQRYFGLGLDKDLSNRSGNWSKLLSPKQIEYGASDAYASLKVYQMIDAERQARRMPSAQHLINAHITPWTIARGQKRKGIEDGNTILYNELHQLRLRLGAEVGVDGCRIMTNAIMRDIIRVMPTTLDELQTVPPTKLCDFHVYGNDIVNVVLEFVEKNAIDLERHKRRRLMRSESMASSQDSGYGSCSQRSFFDDAMYGMAGAEDLRDRSITDVDELEEIDEFSKTAMGYVDLTTLDDEEILAEVQEMEQTPAPGPNLSAIPPVINLTPQESTMPQPTYHQMSLVPEENASINWYRATRIGGSPLSSEEPHVRKGKATKSFDMVSYKKFLKNVKNEMETNKNSSLNQNTPFMRHLNEHA